MKQQKIIAYLILILLLFLLTQCNKAQENEYCTEEFSDVSLTLKYADDEPVLLDSFTGFFK